MIPPASVNEMRLSRRICPNCRASDQIRDNEAIWPRTWACAECSHTIEMRDGIPIFAPALADTVSGMDPSLFEQLAGWEDKNFWFVPRNRLITALLDRYFPAAQNFMEVGCGNGFVLAAISGMRPWRSPGGFRAAPHGPCYRTYTVWAIVRNSSSWTRGLSPRAIYLMSSARLTSWNILKTMQRFWRPCTEQRGPMAAS